jgi:hypothetical protein
MEKFFKLCVFLVSVFAITFVVVCYYLNERVYTDLEFLTFHVFNFYYLLLAFCFIFANKYIVETKFDYVLCYFVALLPIASLPFLGIYPACIKLSLEHLNNPITKLILIQTISVPTIIYFMISLCCGKIIRKSEGIKVVISGSIKIFLIATGAIVISQIFYAMMKN